MADRHQTTELLLQAGRLMLGYNESTAAIRRALTTTAAALTDDPCQVVVSYRGVGVALGGERLALAGVDELRYNSAVQAEVHDILAQTRAGRLDPPDALDRLRTVEADTPRHPRWLACVTLGAAAAALARLLGADVAAAAVAGVATGIGLFARQEFARRHFSMPALPFAAALIGAVAGGLAIRAGWTGTPDLVLVVPALMVVPGPHLINGLLDLIDNDLPMSLARLGLAVGILLAGAAGVALGVELTLPDPAVSESADPGRLTLFADAALAGIVTCGFAVFYNTAWRHLGLATLPGVIGHAARYAAQEAGWGLLAATFLGGLKVGIVAALIARRHKTPVAVVAFAGAVIMIPGLTVYRAFGGVLRLARLPDPDVLAAALGSALQATLVIGGLALGLILGARAVLALAGDGDPPAETVDAAHQSERVCLAPDAESVHAASPETARGSDR